VLVSNTAYVCDELFKNLLSFFFDFCCFFGTLYQKLDYIYYHDFLGKDYPTSMFALPAEKKAFSEKMAAELSNIIEHNSNADSLLQDIDDSEEEKKSSK
jgi:hypothetical protein